MSPKFRIALVCITIALVATCLFRGLAYDSSAIPSEPRSAIGGASLPLDANAENPATAPAQGTLEARSVAPNQEVLVMHLTAVQASTELPVAGANVFAFPPFQRSFPLEDTSRLAACDAQGSAFVDASNSKRTLWAIADGYLPTCFEHVSETSAVARMARADTIAVRVTANSTPIAGVRVCASQGTLQIGSTRAVAGLSVSNPKVGWAAFGSGITDTLGISRLGCLADGIYNIVVGKPGYAPISPCQVTVPGGPYEIALTPIAIAWLDFVGDEVVSVQFELPTEARTGNTITSAAAYISHEIALRVQKSRGSWATACILPNAAESLQCRVVVCGINSGWSVHRVTLRPAPEDMRPDIIDLTGLNGKGQHGTLRLRASPQLETLLGDSGSTVLLRITSSQLESPPPSPIYIIHKTASLGSDVLLPTGSYRITTADEVLGAAVLHGGREVQIGAANPTDLVLAQPTNLSQCRVVATADVPDYDGYGYVSIDQDGSRLVLYQRKILGAHQTVWLPVGEASVTVTARGFAESSNQVQIMPSSGSVQELKLHLKLD